MRNLPLVSWTLFILIGAGLWNGLSISYQNFTGERSCPHLGRIAICYLVLTGYAGMLMGYITAGPLASRHRSAGLTVFDAPPIGAHLNRLLFWGGWTMVFLIALVGSAIEITIGNICPRGSGGTPLCYFSLGLSSVIGLLFARRRRQ